MKTNDIYVFGQRQKKPPRFDFKIGWSLRQLNERCNNPLRLRRSLDDAEVEVRFDNYGYVSGDSVVVGDYTPKIYEGVRLSDWKGSSQLFVVRLTDQGSEGEINSYGSRQYSLFDLKQEVKELQPRFLNDTSQIYFDGTTFLYCDKVIEHEQGTLFSSSQVSGLGSARGNFLVQGDLRSFRGANERFHFAHSFREGNETNGYEYKPCLVQYFKYFMGASPTFKGEDNLYLNNGRSVVTMGTKGDKMQSSTNGSELFIEPVYSSTSRYDFNTGEAITTTTQVQPVWFGDGVTAYDEANDVSNFALCLNAEFVGGSSPTNFKTGLLTELFLWDEEFEEEEIFTLQQNMTEHLKRFNYYE